MKKVILTRLSLLTAPGMRTDLLTSGMVVPDHVTVDDDGKVIVPVNVPQDYTGDLGAVQAMIEERLKGLQGVTKLLVVLTAERAAEPAPAAPEAPRLKKRPTDAEIIKVVAAHFGVDAGVAAGWLAAMRSEAA